MNKTWGLTLSNLALKCPTHEWTDKIGHNLKPIMKIMRFANRRGKTKFNLKSILKDVTEMRYCTNVGEVV